MENCKWEQIEGVWLGDCGALRMYPPDNGVCPFCGKPVEIVEEGDSNGN